MKKMLKMKPNVLIKRDYSNILIIKLGAMGDVLRTTFLARGFKEKYRDCHITWLTSRRSASLLLRNPYIDKIVSWEERKVIRNKKFSYVVSLDDESDVCAFASAVKTDEFHGAFIDSLGKTVFTPDVEPWFGMGLLRPASDGGKKEANRLKKANRRSFQQIHASIFGLTEMNNMRPVLNLSSAEINAGTSILRKIGTKLDGLVVGINLGAGSRWPLKMLPLEVSADVCSKISGFAETVLLGGFEDFERNRKIAVVAGKKVKVAEPFEDPRKFAGVVNACNIVVTSDSLALHIATALKKPVVAFFGPTSPWEIDLFGNGEKIFRESRCLCCYKKEPPAGGKACIDRIKAEDVVESVIKLGKKNYKSAFKK